MKNYRDICFICNDTEYCHSCSQTEICFEFKKCFGYKPYIMWGAMTGFDNIMRCDEKWREYNEQIVKQ